MCYDEKNSTEKFSSRKGIHMPSSITLRVDWSEIDTMGHVNNLAILKYVQSGRVSYCEQLGFTPRLDAEGPIVAATSCQFKKPVIYPDTVTVNTCVISVGRTSITMRHELRDGQGDLVALAEDVIVHYDYKNGVKKEIPDDMRAAISALEGGQAD